MGKMVRMVRDATLKELVIAAGTMGKALDPKLLRTDTLAALNDVKKVAPACDQRNRDRCNAGMHKFVVDRYPLWTYRAQSRP